MLRWVFFVKKKFATCLLLGQIRAQKCKQAKSFKKSVFLRALSLSGHALACWMKTWLSLYLIMCKQAGQFVNECPAVCMLVQLWRWNSFVCWATQKIRKRDLHLTLGRLDGPTCDMAKLDQLLLSDLGFSLSLFLVFEVDFSGKDKVTLLLQMPK